MKSIDELKLKDKKYIIFDLDGTLIDSIGVWNTVDRILIKKYSGIDVDSNLIQIERDNFLNNNTNGNIYVNYCEYLIERHRLTGISKENLCFERSELFKDVSLGISFKPDAVNLFKRLKELGFVLILATVSGINQVIQYSTLNKNMISEMSILEEFDFVITKDDVVNKKPHPEIYNKVMEHYGANASECLIFEDSYTGVMAARNANVEVVNIYDEYADADRNLIDEITTYKINSYSEFLKFVNTVYSENVKALVVNN